MSEEDRKWLEQLIRENKESDSELTYTYCPFSVLYALQQENQQLKEELQKADSITQSCIFEGKEESEINFRKAINLIEQYKSILDEIREYIEDNILRFSYIDELKSYHNATTEDVDNILEILDKVKENERGTTESNKS